MERPVENPTDEQLTTFLNEIIASLQIQLPKLTGTKITFNLSKKKFKDLKLLAYDLLNIELQMKKLNNTTLPTDFKQRQRINLIEQFLRITFGNVQDPISEITQSFNPENGYNKIIKDSEYVCKLRTSIHQIIANIRLKFGNLDLIQKYFDSVGEDVFTAYQMSFRLNNKIKYVLTERKIITKTVLERYIERYKEIANFMEFIIALLYGLKQILKEEYMPYSEVKKLATANQIKILEKDPLFVILVESYNSHIRNAINHGHFYLNPTESKIELADRNEKISWSYDEFIRYVQEVTRKMTILSHFNDEISYFTFQNLALVKSKSI